MPGLPLSVTPNQLVAYNLTRIRKARGLTQAEAADRLNALGAAWSRKAYSAAECSYDSDRVRQFTADDLVRFAGAFAVPVAYFLLPDSAESWAAAESLTQLASTDNPAYEMRLGELGGLTG